MYATRQSEESYNQNGKKLIRNSYKFKKYNDTTVLHSLETYIEAAGMRILIAITYAAVRKRNTVHADSDYIAIPWHGSAVHTVSTFFFHFKYTYW